MPDGAEKRRFARTEVNAAVQYRIADGETARDGWLGNISAGGVLLWTEDELPVGTTLYLRISAEELGDTEMEVTATIVRLDPARQSGWFGYGCRFDAIYSGPFVDAG
ncbi:MAG: PilZ domain-containing protein [Candidatus Contendobacter sp.]|nr:MAG: PilZ domain-containing protein [Candidatus Contendobacter sp.]